MSSILKKSLEVPYPNKVTQEDGLLSQAWQNFFRTLYLAVSSLGLETTFLLNNNQSTPLNIDGLQFNYQKVTCVFVDYIVQRVTQSVGRQELIEVGTFRLAYRPFEQEWVIDFPNSNWPDDSGVTLSVSADGQVQYTTTNITGMPLYSKITYRAKTLSARISQ